MKLLVCNAGSTSLKFKLFEMPKERVLAEGKVDALGKGDDEPDGECHQRGQHKQREVFFQCFIHAA